MNILGGKRYPVRAKLVKVAEIRVMDLDYLPDKLKHSTIL